MPPVDPNREQRAPDLRHLQWLALGLPIAAVIVGEILRALLIDPYIGDAVLSHILSGALAIGAVIVFTAVMFVRIERAQRRVVLQNRALRIANAVSVATQGERPMDEVIGRALRTIVDSTGALCASVTVFEGNEGGGSVHRVDRTDGTAVAAGPHPVELPLAAGTALVGRLHLEMPTEPGPDDVPERILQNACHQLASAIQMGRLIADLRRRRQETSALYEVALQVTSQFALADILGTIVRHARQALDVDEAIICLSDASSQAVREAKLVEYQNVAGNGTVCFAPGDDPISMRHPGARPGFCPVRMSPNWGATADAKLRTAEAFLGTLWVGRVDARPFDQAGLDLLAGLADLGAIAIVSARLREGERQGAILAERERIAREMHDSLAQVLATNHLRLRALEDRPEVAALPAVATEVQALGDMMHDAYRDVREAILGLRESSRSDRHLLESLRVYVEKFSRQSGVATTLETTVDGDLGLPLGTEIQVIRVIQEALTNVRKHSGARKATVLVKPDETGVTLAVEDDGRGFDPANELVNREDSFGMRGMRERMDLVGGTLSVHSVPGHGTRVTARVPRPSVPAPRRIEEPRAERESNANLAR
jgi:signal transduction histidine kinase